MQLMELAVQASHGHGQRNPARRTAMIGWPQDGQWPRELASLQMQVAGLGADPETIGGWRGMMGRRVRDSHTTITPRGVGSSGRGPRPGCGRSTAQSR